MTRLALLRHGLTDWNRAGRIQGRTDRPLLDEARAGLARLRLPSPWDEAALVSSPLLRARETAALVAGRPPETAPDLSEMDWGVWEGQRGTDLLADPDCAYRDTEDWGWDFAAPGGESLRALRDRALHWAEALQEDTVAVTHIGVMRVLLAVATGWSFKGPAPFRIKRNRLYVLTRDDGGWQFDATPLPLIEASPCA